ncbi:MAG: redox-regulated ATPase YchF [Firmicutes bacterium]|nr:redox-regulated ATPase YchF [Bacillota bacterium]
MGLEIGIIGLPNVGKSTLFNALTRLDVPAANYPFCTIEPNRGSIPIPDERLLKIAEVVQPEIVTGAAIEFVDIAGLVAGASRGEGLGNQFLAHIRQVDALAHVVRVFSDDNVVTVSGKVDPLGDADVIDLELALADLQTIEKRMERTTRMLKTGERIYKEELELLEEYQSYLEKGVPLRRTNLPQIADLPLLTFKPVMYIANVAEGREDEAEILAERAAADGAELIPVCAALEAEIAQLGPEEGRAFLQELGMDEPALHKVIAAGLRLLNLITFYTIKGPETRAWLLPRDTPAPRGAGQIHSDMERGFIRAEVVPWNVLVEEGSFAACREKGLLQVEGKDYLIQDGDVILFRFNV